jgi:hypothetical protein
LGVVVKVESVSMVLYELKATLKVEAGVVVATEGFESAEVDSIVATMDVYELAASFELADDAACPLYFAAWCTTPSLLDSIFVPFSRAISSNAMQAKSTQRIAKRKGDLVANGV